MNPEPPARDPWADALPHLDEALDRLPSGEEREAATKEVIAFLKYNGRSDLVPEWQAR